MALLGGLALFSRQDPRFYPFGIFFVMMTLYLGVGYLLGILARGFDFKRHLDLVAALPFEMPTGLKGPVDIFIPTCGEDIEVIRNTIWHANRVQWAWGGTKVWVLDDGARDDVREAAGLMGATYVVRPNRGELKKAGNLRHAFGLADGAFFLVLDADFAPHPLILRNLMGYMRDPKVAIVQSPQFFRIDPKDSWVQKGAAYIQELFYRVIQVNRDHYNGAICVGTCALYRREALEPFGGTAPIGYSEDMHTGWMLLRAGWRIRYIPVNLATGLCPDVASSFFTQQYRWCMGSTTLFLNPEFWRTSLPLGLRLSYLSGMLYYWATAAGVFLNPLPSILMSWWFPRQIHWYNYGFAVPSLLFNTLVMALWSRAPYGFYAPCARLLSYWAHIFALKDKLMGTAMPWVSTGSKEARRNSKYLAFRRAHGAWTAAQVALLVMGISHNWERIDHAALVPLGILAGFNLSVNLRILWERKF